ncbi:MAG: hypothetical protein KDC92_09155, partial [Bacteroidetes bacterium]|nr:hypothetical protein [Bacteroidota bacterium]
NRMNTLRKELALKKIEKERLQKEQEREMKELLEKQNVELEAKVKERTLQLEEKNRIVEQDREIIRHERQKSDDLLLNILPNSIADRLKEGNEMIADHFDEVSVFFADLVGFTQLSKAMRPSELVNLLNKIFSEFDKTADKYGIEKIKTIGDAYMCVSGLPIADKDHASKMAHFALEILDVLKRFEPELGEHKCAVRIGVHCGPVVAGVIGKRKFAYDLWGDTVNLASRLESHGVPMRVQCSENFAQALGAEFKLETRGEVALKGAGTHTTYFLEKAEPVAT